MANGLRKIGQGLISFARDIPVPQLQIEQSERDIAAQQVALNQQQLEANQADIRRKQEIQQLSNIAFDPNNPDKDKALTRLFQLKPEFATQVQKGLRIETQAGLENAARRAASIQAQPTKELRDAEIRKQINDNPNLDLTDTEQLLGMTFEEQEIPLRVTQAAALSTQQRAGLQSGVEEPFALRTFRGLAETAGLTGDELESAARINLGVDPRAVGSAEQTIAVNAQLLEMVAELRETLAERTKFAERTGTSRADAIIKGAKAIQVIDKNILNIDRAIKAIDEGAVTGVIESQFFPSFREATLKLEQVQKELGLDIIGAVTFGQLSKGELDLALATALPVGLKPPALRRFLVEKQVAQRKMRDYFDSQIQFLDKGGSIAGFLQQQRDRVKPTAAPAAPTAPEALDPVLLEFMTPEERALFE